MSRPAARCLRCDSPLPAGYDSRRPCPRCLLALGLSHAPPERDRPEKPSPPDPRELAADFPELEIGELLGLGGMGAVYRARQKELDRDVALKLLWSPDQDDPAFEERFAQEARALARLAHPGIVAVHDFGRAGRHCYLVMELVEGTNLRRLMNERALGPRQALRVVEEISAALQYAHENGVVHRDIKPENVLLGRDGRVKIVDFGLAKLAAVAGPAGLRLTRSHQAMGTPQYMAPEQIESPLEVDHRADIYALGVVFYELLTGELPLGRFAPPSQRVEVDVRLDEIVLKTLEKEPERRYQEAAEVGTAVEDVRLRPARPGKARRQGEPTEEAARSKGRRTSCFWLLVILSVLLCLPLSCVLFLVPANIAGKTGSEELKAQPVRTEGVQDD